MADTPQLRGMLARRRAPRRGLDGKAPDGPSRSGEHRPAHDPPEAGLAPAAQAARTRQGHAATARPRARGHKGAGSRAGVKRKVGYEGGQTPIHMRMRKLRGPHMKKSMPFEPFRTHSQPVNLSDLEARFDAGAEVTPDTLRAAGLAKRQHPVKVLGRGEISKKLTVRAHAFSATAREKIEGAGGTCEVIVPRSSCSRAAADAADARELASSSRDPREARLHRGDARCSTGSAPTSPRRASTSTR